MVLPPLRLVDGLPASHVGPGPVLQPLPETEEELDEERVRQQLRVQVREQALLVPERTLVPGARLEDLELFQQVAGRRSHGSSLRPAAAWALGARAGSRLGFLRSRVQVEMLCEERPEVTAGDLRGRPPQRLGVEA